MSMRGLPSLARPATWPQQGSTSQEGMLLFIQYAFMPNRLEYCGTDDHGALYDYWSARETDPGLLEMLQTFSGALPYLKLIAHSNGLSDAFDRQVVEAYWVGNALLERVEMRQFFESIIERFGQQLKGKVRDYVTQKIPLGARPHHSFHVFDVHSRVGRLTHSLEVMENCRISWGCITAVEPAHYVIEAQPLTLQDGKLALAAPASRRILRQIDEKGFTREAKAGDWVSVHWNWACDRLQPAQVRYLEQYTGQHLRLANLTL
jgi:hypothetical protein